MQSLTQATTAKSSPRLDPRSPYLVERGISAYRALSARNWRQVACVYGPERVQDPYADQTATTPVLVDSLAQCEIYWQFRTKSTHLPEKTTVLPSLRTPLLVGR